jgi:hypothetical protein
MSKTFIIFWCSEGLESVTDISELLELANQREKEKIFDILKDPEGNHPNEHVREINRIVHMMMLRGKFNTQRNYELYCIHTTDDISTDDFVRYFDDNPQETVNLIRERGTKLYSDKAGHSKVVIV